MWATTIGAVLGPNLVGPGEALGRLVGMPTLTGAYLFTIVAQVAAIALYLIWLRPDPLLLAQRIATDHVAGDTVTDRPDQPHRARFAILAIAATHTVMISVMAMTPVHLIHHGAELTVIGLTISLHIAGMYALSPVFGALSDRIGRIPTVLVGQAILVASLLLAVVGQSSVPVVGASLILLGLGWSASTVAGAALLTESTAPRLRTRRQGRSDLIMNLVGAAGATGAGVLLDLIAFRASRQWG
ncbi:MFS transporter [Tessaracoccus coleopterorum]|uniref:MFS transporter n=1 Tax=Tessaracoccus coleopterorum TaxID=2714950 RepID=UPI0018D2AE37